MSEKKINEAIGANEVFLIDEKGRNLGIMSLVEALAYGDELCLDVLQLNDQERPMCKLVDYEKMEYDRKKREKKHQKAVKLKEVRFTPSISERDLQIKSKHICNFLTAGHKVKIAIKFGNRRLSEKANVNHIEEVVNQVRKLINVEYKVDGKPNIGQNEYSINLIP